MDKIAEILKILEAEKDYVSLDCDCADCKKVKRRIAKAILALIEQEQKPMRLMQGLLKDSAEHLKWAYRNSTIAEDVQATLDEIDAVLKGEGK